MNEVVREWVAKAEAEADFATANREIKAEKDANYDAVCFHAQQCSEKYLKALLIERGVTPPKTHDLVALHRILAPVSADWQWPVEELRLLTRAAVTSRYPGETAGCEEATAALAVCARLRARLRHILGADHA